MLKCADLNYSNRPVRTRMPGGVGGARSGFLTAPIPIIDNRLQILLYGTCQIYTSGAYVSLDQLTVAIWPL
jgi:hypothetical protein